MIMLAGSMAAGSRHGTEAIAESIFTLRFTGERLGELPGKDVGF